MQAGGGGRPLGDKPRRGLCSAANGRAASCGDRDRVNGCAGVLGSTRSLESVHVMELLESCAQQNPLVFSEAPV